jgi:hypothetical protein
MSCCGNKRSDWLNQAKSQDSVRNDKNYVQKKEETPKTFQYTGTRGLTIKSPSGKTYTFLKKGETQNVDYWDSFACMAEPELRLVKNFFSKT